MRSGGLAGQHARLDFEGVEYLEEVVDEDVEGDLWRAVDGGSGASVVIGHRALLAAQVLERRQPHLAAASPAAVGYQRSTTGAEAGCEDVRIEELQKHAAASVFFNFNDIACSQLAGRQLAVPRSVASTQFSAIASPTRSVPGTVTVA